MKLWYLNCNSQICEIVLIVCVSLLLPGGEDDGQGDWSQKCLNHHLVAGSSRDQKLHLLHVSGWDVDQTKLKSQSTRKNVS